MENEPTELPTEGVLAIHYPNNGRPWNTVHLGIPAISIAEHERRTNALRAEIERLRCDLIEAHNPGIEDDPKWATLRERRIALYDT